MALLGLKMINVAVIAFGIYILINTAMFVRLVSIRKKNVEKFLAISQKYTKNPLFLHIRSNLLLQRFQLFCSYKRWGEMVATLRMINLPNASKRYVTRIYIHCVISLIRNNQLAIAEAILIQLGYRNYPEMILAKAILEYHKRNIPVCAQLMNLINPSGFNGYYMGFFNLYLGLTVEQSRQEEYFEKAKQLNNTIVTEHLNEILKSINSSTSTNYTSER